MNPDLALAASAREWPDRLHRYILDHGGGKVITRVMTADQAVETSFDVLLIDDICSFLSPGLVNLVKQNGSEVIGVYSADDGSHAKRRLLECGISDVIETAAEATEFIEKVRATLDHRRQVPRVPEKVRTGWSIGLVGVTGGVGATEVAVGIANALSKDLSVTLADADPDWPSVAQRLDLPLHPNIRTGLDAVVHGNGNPREALQEFGRLKVLGGVADHGTGSPLALSELEMLLDTLSEYSQALVVDLGQIDRVSRGVFRTFDSIALVATGDPVGMARLFVSLNRFRDLHPFVPVLLVINRVPVRPYYEAEIRNQVRSSLPGMPLAMVPFDRSLSESVWEGEAAASGPFSRAMKRMAAVISEGVSV